MAKTYRYPVFLWHDGRGVHTARLLDDDGDGVAVAGTRKEALEQLREYLDYLQRTRGYALTADFRSPQLRAVKVSVYPEYPSKKKTFACREAVRLRLPCVTGERESGLLTAMLPTLDQDFEYHDRDGFDKLAAHYVRATLGGKTPREISRYLPPAGQELTEIVLTLRQAPTHRGSGRESKELASIADPLGSRDFQKLARTWEREAQVAELVRILTQDGTSACLVGATGGGKTSVLGEAVRRLERGRDSSEGGLFWMTSAGRIIAGMRWLGQWQERCEKAIAELAEVGGVLCVENLLELVRKGGEGAESSIAAFLLPYLREGELRLVAEATPQEMDACERLLPGLIGCLQTVRLPEFDEEAVRRLLDRAAESFARNDKVVFPPSARAGVHQLFRRFLPYASFPGKPIAFMSALVGEVLDAGGREIPDESVRASFGTLTGLPERFLRDDVPLSRDETVAALAEKVIGQEAAVGRIADMLLRFKAGVNDPRRPLAAFLFCGPTGVGKTALVRAVGDFLFPNKPEKERLVRLDMSEYSGHDAAARLLGRADGEPSELVRRVRSNPFTVLLLDEVEKADDAVFDVLLNVLDEGRLTDAFGRETSFRCCVIVMTSNLGAGGAGGMGFTEPGAEPQVFDSAAVRSFFRPEFLNRLDHVVPFRALGREQIEVVATKELSEIAAREGLAERGLTLDFEEPLVRYLAETGFDARYGARPLQRRIEEVIIAPLARWILAHPETRDTTLHLSLLPDGNVALALPT